MVCRLHRDSKTSRVHHSDCRVIAACGSLSCRRCRRRDAGGAAGTAMFEGLVRLAWKLACVPLFFTHLAIADSTGCCVRIGSPAGRLCLAATVLPSPCPLGHYVSAELDSNQCAALRRSTALPTSNLLQIFLPHALCSLVAVPAGNPSSDRVSGGNVHSVGQSHIRGWLPAVPVGLSVRVGHVHARSMRGRAIRGHAGAGEPRVHGTPSAAGAWGGPGGGTGTRATEG